MCDFWKSIEEFDPKTADPHFCWALLEMEKERCVRIRNGTITPTEKCELVSPQAILDRTAPVWHCNLSKELLEMESNGLLTIDGGAFKLTEEGKQKAIDLKINQAIANDKMRGASEVQRNGLCPCGSGFKFKQCCFRRENDDKSANR